jgi:hypothetical protein
LIRHTAVFCSVGSVIQPSRWIAADRRRLKVKHARMSCRIDRSVTEDDRVNLIISGRITAEDLDILRDVLGQESRAVAAIDLKDVLLIDRDAVKFMVVAEGNGIELRNCPPYVREWVARERAQMNSDPSK